jgi:hypothetical protein
MTLDGLTGKREAQKKKDESKEQGWYTNHGSLKLIGCPFTAKQWPQLSARTLSELISISLIAHKLLDLNFKEYCCSIDF